MNRIHRWIGLIIGVQVLFWMVSGFYFTLYPIEEIRGTHLHQSFASQLDLRNGDILPPGKVAQREAGVRRIELIPYLDGPFYRVETAFGQALYDAVTGEKHSPLSQAFARKVALAAWAGDGELTGLTLMETPPREAGTSHPVWRADFSGYDTASLYIEVTTGRVSAVRTAHWRLFDMLWGLHIMDWTGRETFTSWWMTLFAGVGVLFTLTGIIILLDQISHRNLLK